MTNMKNVKIKILIIVFIYSWQSDMQTAIAEKLEAQQ